MLTEQLIDSLLQVAKLVPPTAADQRWAFPVHNDLPDPALLHEVEQRLFRSVQASAAVSNQLV